MTFEELKSKIQKHSPDINVDLLKKAYEYARSAHEGQNRMTGEPYINHPMETAVKLAEFKLDQTTIIAGILHDVPEDTDRTVEDIRKEFGSEVSFLVEGITKLGTIKYRGVDRFTENLRKMFVAMAEDVRVIFIKFADRMHNLETLNALPKVKQQRIARETIEIYAPIAGRLGMHSIKGQLEDRAFPFAYPEEYQWLMETATHRREEQKKLVKQMIKQVNKTLKIAGIEKFTLDGRAKNNFSLYKKLIRKKYNKDINRIYDLVALRVIVPTIKDCYQVLGIIHQNWKPIPERFKDYIAQPKPNGYQSLHTDVFTDDNHQVEFQIRTKEMNEIAEYGIAAHFHYKESGQKNAPPLSKDGEAWLAQLKKIQEEITENAQLLETLKLDIFSDRIFVLTPEGDVIDLPEGANAIDFAYHIHSVVGDCCGGVKINGKMSSLTEPLKNGDMVEIILDKKRAGPSKDWLKTVKTHTAQSKIKAALRKQRLSIIDQLLNK